MATATVDHVGEAVKRIAAGEFTPNTGFRAFSPTVVMVRYNGLDRDVVVHDPRVRPPEPGGVWLDDLISAACRIQFGCNKGRARPVPGLEGRLEFREAWPEPPLLRIEAKPQITINPCPRFPMGLTDRLVVKTSALVGADEGSVIAAQAQAYCEYKIGPGTVRWESESRLMYLPSGQTPGTPHAVRFRHTIIRSGGHAAELVTAVSPAVAKSWPGVYAAVEANCRKQFGPGRLKYEPELGETYFTYEE